MLNIQQKTDPTDHQIEALTQKLSDLLLEHSANVNTEAEFLRDTLSALVSCTAHFIRIGHRENQLTEKNVEVLAFQLHETILEATKEGEKNANPSH